METKKTSVFSNSLIWFGAAVSIAEILTGTLIAPLGFAKGLAAILIGHSIGCILLYYAGLIGAQTGRSAMETVKMSFGQRGSLLFSILNVLQLVGWTAVMIVSGAKAAGAIALSDHTWLWSLAIGAFIILWIFVGIKNLSKLNVFAMGGLFLLTIVLSSLIFKGNPVGLLQGGMSFGSAVELSVAMPLSWLPLISDYTRDAAKPKAATLSSAAVYFFTSSWMYVIGLCAALFTGESDVVTIMMKAGLGTMGLLIIIFSTVTTTFLDVYSAGVSMVSIRKKCNEKWASVIICIIGTLLAIFTPMQRFESFLYIIGSVFAPMVAIQLTDVFLIKKDYSSQDYQKTNLFLWVIGFVLYRIFMRIDTPFGNTLPVMLITMFLSLLVNKEYIKNIRRVGERNVK